MKQDAKAIIDSSIEELVADLDNGYSDRIEEYLSWKAKFHKYSFYNNILIQFQRPDATFVKGFVQWKNMGYHVNKGAKAIFILAPMTGKYIMREYAGGESDKVYWKDMTPLERKRTSEHKSSNYFRDVYVFDIKDTNCTEYPTFFTDLGNNNEEKYETVLDRFFSMVNIVEDDTIPASYFDMASKNIVIKKQDIDNKLLTLVHELAHFFCDKDIPEYRNTYNYQEGEIHAESVSFIVCKFLGVDNPFSKDYILNWKGNAAKIREHLSVIDKVATTIMNTIEGEEINAAKEPVLKTR